MDVEYIEISGNGKNALDFHIAYYVGSLAAAHPEACFHVISGDTGFDPLIQHLAVNKICCMRCKTVEEVGLHAEVHAILDNFATRKDAKPRTLKALRNTIKALLAHVDDSRLDALLEQLASRGDIALEGSKVAYRLES
jgi:hypothetical protein